MQEHFTGHAVRCAGCKAASLAVQSVDHRDGLLTYATRSDD